jgi:serine O-acetyltransferase
MRELDIDNINKYIGEIADNYSDNALYFMSSGCMPNRSAIVHIIMELRQLMFPGYFEEDHLGNELTTRLFIGNLLIEMHDQLYKQISAALTQHTMATKGTFNQSDVAEQTEEICENFFSSFGRLQKMLMKDIQAAFDGDPAAKTKEEIIYCYPGLLAIFIYRFAHELYKMKVPFIPRIMTEYAHGHTGIDINPGAEIGEYFFIDHGSGVVIGETTEIGNNVKIYQGVTLGALSTRSGQLLRDVKRHPTIEDNVTIYSNASILGGKTVIGKGSVIGGNSFITKSVPPYSRLTANSTMEIKPIDHKPDDVFD